MNEVTLLLNRDGKIAIWEFVEQTDHSNEDDYCLMAQASACAENISNRHWTASGLLLNSAQKRQVALYLLQQVRDKESGWENIFDSIIDTFLMLASQKIKIQTKRICCGRTNPCSDDSIPPLLRSDNDVNNNANNNVNNNVNNINIQLSTPSSTP
jgi:hypothetical protein